MSIFCPFESIFFSPFFGLTIFPSLWMLKMDFRFSLNGIHVAIGYMLEWGTCQNGVYVGMGYMSECGTCTAFSTRCLAVYWLSKVKHGWLGHNANFPTMCSDFWIIIFKKIVFMRYMSEWGTCTPFSLLVEKNLFWARLKAWMIRVLCKLSIYERIRQSRILVTDLS